MRSTLRNSRTFLILHLLAISVVTTGSASAEDTQHFIEVVQPLLRSKCISCHGPGNKAPQNLMSLSLKLKDLTKDFSKKVNEFSNWAEGYRDSSKVKTKAIKPEVVRDSI